MLLWEWQSYKIVFPQSIVFSNILLTKAVENLFTTMFCILWQTEEATRGGLLKEMLLKISKSPQGTGNHLCLSLLFKRWFIKNRLQGTGVFLWILQNFLQYLFKEHLHTTALLPLLFFLKNKFDPKQLIFFIFMKTLTKKYDTLLFLLLRTKKTKQNKKFFVRAGAEKMEKTAGSG